MIADDLTFDAPADLAAVQADQELLDLLGRGVIVMVDPLTRALSTWRQVVRAEPIPQLLDTDEALRIVAIERDHRDDGSALVGLLWALVLSAPLWALLLWAILWVGAR